MFRIFDTETASLSGGVVEIAWVDIDEDLNELSHFRSLVNPERSIEESASQIHGIYDNDVKDAPTLRQLVSVWGDGPHRLIGHNVGFDLRMVRGSLPCGDSMCTLALARRYVSDCENHKLQTLADFFQTPVGTAHNALDDVRTTAKVLKHLVELSGVSLGTLWDRAQEPKMLVKMPFGLHKGKKITSIPKQYRGWLLQQSDLHKDLRYTLERLSVL